jgi:hypothetical protein
MRMFGLVGGLLVFLCMNSAFGSDRTIGVFVALADNQTQGIVPVSARMGNGEDPENNLYWGTADGLKGFFDRSSSWRPTTAPGVPGDRGVLRTRTYRHTTQDAVLSAFAYRGSAIRQCIEDFEAAIRVGSYDLVVYIGHNGLMDFSLPALSRSPTQAKRPDCIVLCCVSNDYFFDRLTVAGGRPILLTTQLMYPGAFILGAVAEQWLAGGTLVEFRDRAGAAYARNQGISLQAAKGVFALLQVTPR